MFKVREIRKENLFYQPEIAKNKRAMLLHRSMFALSILYFVANCLECLWVVHTEVCEDLTVDVDTVSVEETHELRVAETLEASGSIDTLDPECAEVALVVTTITECVSKTLFLGVLSYSPYILACADVTSCKSEDFLASCT